MVIKVENSSFVTGMGLNRGYGGKFSDLSKKRDQLRPSSIIEVQCNIPDSHVLLTWRSGRD